MEWSNKPDAPRDGNAGAPAGGGLDRTPGASSPMRLRAFVRLHRSSLVTGLLLLVGFAVQFVVVSVVYQLVDLSISLMEVWAELARKHLELTL